MTYRLADTEDLDQLVAMSDQAKESFKARNIDQWQKGEPNRQVMEASILQSQLHVLEDMGQVVGMITIVPGPEASYASIDGAWLNQEPYYAFHRVCVKDSLKGRGLAARLFSEAEQYVLQSGIRNILIWGNYAEMMVLGQDTSSGNLQSSELVVRNIDFLPLTILFIVGLIAFVLFEKKFQKYEY